VDQMSDMALPLSTSRLNKRGSVADYAYDKLRDRIIFLELAPDSVLSRTRLSDELGVSLTPLREALQRLQGEGLVQIIPQSKTYVARIDKKKLNAAHFLRVSLESEVVRRLTADHSQVLIETLNAIVDQQRKLIDTPEQANQFHALDELFHQTMFEAAGQPDLHKMLLTQLGDLARLRRLELPNTGKTQWVVDAHQRIITSIKAGDPEISLNALRTDISASISKIAEISAQYPDYFC